MTITEHFGMTPRMKVVEFFLDFPHDRFTIPDLIEGVGMSKTTARAQVDQLLEKGWIIEMPKVGKSPTYQINLKHPSVKTMQKVNSYESEKIALEELQKAKFSSFRTDLQKMLEMKLANIRVADAIEQIPDKNLMKKITLRIAKAGDAKVEILMNEEILKKLMADATVTRKMWNKLEEKEIEI